MFNESTSTMTSGVLVPAIRPADMKQAFAVLPTCHEDHKATGQNRAVGLAAFAESGISIANRKEILLRCVLLLQALDRGEFSDFRHGDEIDERLLDLFATFPFRVVNVQPDGSFQLNKDEFEKELEEIRN